MDQTKAVRMRVGISSSEGWSYAPGQEVTLPASLADAWVACGQAELVTAPPVVMAETAEEAEPAAPVEPAKSKSRKGGGRK